MLLPELVRHGSNVADGSFPCGPINAVYNYSIRRSRYATTFHLPFPLLSRTGNAAIHGAGPENACCSLPAIAGTPLLYFFVPLQLK